MTKSTLLRGNLIGSDRSADRHGFCRNRVSAKAVHTSMLLVSKFLARKVRADGVAPRKPSRAPSKARMGPGRHQAHEVFAQLGRSADGTSITQINRGPGSGLPCVARGKGAAAALEGPCTDSPGMGLRPDTFQRASQALFRTSSGVRRGVSDHVAPGEHESAPRPLMCAGRRLRAGASPPFAVRREAIDGTKPGGDLFGDIQQKSQRAPRKCPRSALKALALAAS